MDYEGPTADDLANVNALNGAFLRTSNGVEGAAGRGLSTLRLTDTQMQRLAAAPFLLFSLREHDSEYWQRVLVDDGQPDLLDRTRPPGDAIQELQVAGLGFLWQLSRRNPFAARIICGAPVVWCERLADVTLVSLLNRVAHREDLLVPRFAGEHFVWIRLLQSGVSPKRHLQLMSQQLALQAMLTRAQSARYDRVQAAACGLRTPAQRVAERHPGGIHDTKV